MVVGNIQLNDVGYLARTFERNGRTQLVHRYLVDPFTTSRRSTGVSQRQDKSSPDFRAFGPWTGGFGGDLIPSDLTADPAQYRRFRDSRIETRFRRAYLAILNEDSTHTGLEVIRASAVFGGDLWAIWQDDTSTDIVARKYTGSTTTWDGGGSVILSGVEISAFDLMAHKTHLIALFANANDHLIYRSTDGVTWNAATTPPTANLLANVVTANEDINGGLLAQVGNEAVAVVWHENNGTITFFSSTDAGDVWTDEAVDIPSGDGPLGVAVYPGIDNSDKLYVLTAEALYEIDTAPSTWTILRTELNNSSGGDDFNCRRLVVHDGLLWIALGTSTSAPVKIATMDNSGGTRVFNTKMGLNVLDGVPSDLLGGVRYMLSVEDFLYISVGGEAANRNARVLCYTGQDANGFPQWHHMFRFGTADQEIQWIGFSTRDDGTARLHFAKRTAAGTSDAEFLGEPNTDPASGITIQRQSTGLLSLPEIEGGMPLDTAAWLRVGVNAASLSADTSGEYISVTHGLDGAVRTTTSLGNILSGTKTLDYASGAGEGGVSDALQLILFRDSGDTTQSPELRSVEMNYLKQPGALEGFIFQLDIDGSAELDERDIKTIITTLEAARDLKGTLPNFRYADASQVFVKVRSIDWLETPEAMGEVGDDAVPDPNTRRSGIAEVRVETVIN